MVSSHQRPRGRHSRPDAGMEVPAAQSRPTGTRARPARGTGPADGSAIVEAWLNELEAAQPQHGPLLRNTLDQVGNLPAVGDDGSIYTVSHDRYWFAAGCARSYASIQADNRRITAVLAEAQAKEARDDPTMARKEAEAEFWESVKHWVGSAAPSRMAPGVMPAWLVRFNPAWNPN
jgi:hypothetical protein